MTVGTELKQAREKAGLSPEQISERTKIQLYKIDSLENGTFELLPQGIYLDGIVRAYAQQVGVDPEPLVERVRLERGKLPGDSEIPFSAPIDLHGTSAPRTVHAIDVPAGDDSLNSFAAESTVVAVPNARPATHAPRALNAPLAPYALDLPLSPHVIHAPARPARGRGRLVLPVLALLAAVFWGAYLLHVEPPGSARCHRGVSAPPGKSVGNGDDRRRSCVARTAAKRSTNPVRRQHNIAQRRSQTYRRIHKCSHPRGCTRSRHSCAAAAPGFERRPRFCASHSSR